MAVKVCRRAADRRVMTRSVSPQMRIVVLAGFLVLAGLALAVFTLSRRSQSSTPASPAKPHHARAHSAPAQARPAPPARRPSTKPVARPKPAGPVTIALAHGWPVKIARAFARSRVVLVEIYSSDAPLDRDALREARAGAAQTRSAVVALDVSARADSATRKVIQKLGMVDSPAMLVLRRPGTLFVQLDGYSDKDTVAQAASNAALPT